MNIYKIPYVCYVLDKTEIIIYESVMSSGSSENFRRISINFSEHFPGNINKYPFVHFTAELQ